MKEEHTENTDDNKGPEEVLCISCDAEYPIEEQNIESDDNAASQKTPFFRDDGENEIRILDRQELQFLLGTLKQPFSENSSRTDGYFGLPYVVVSRKGQVVGI